MKEDMWMPFYKIKNKEDILCAFDKRNNNKKILIKGLNIEGFSFFRIKRERTFKR